MKKVLVIQGPNLNLLGRREKEHYGRMTLSAIHSAMEKEARKLKMALSFIQSNHEGELVEAIQGAARDRLDAIIINPAAYTHTSVALRDALAAVGIPFVEVHISNTHAREAFRRKSLISPLASGIVIGFGPEGYLLALRGVSSLLLRPVGS